MRLGRSLAFLAVWAVLVHAETTRGEDYYWLDRPESDDWLDPDNWSPAGPPTAADTAHINQGTASLSALAYCQRLLLGEAAGDAGSLLIAGSNAGLEAGTVSIGLSGIGQVEQTGGTSRLHYMELGIEPGSEGTYLLNGGTLDADVLNVGVRGKGVFRHLGGVFDANNVYMKIGLESGSEGLIELAGSGVLETGQIEIGSSGSGRMIQRGSMKVTGNLILGRNKGSHGTFELSENGWFDAATRFSLTSVGGEGNGTFLQSGGTANFYELRIGHGQYEREAQGRYELSGNGTLTANSEVIGMHTPGTFIQNGGNNQAGSISIGGKTNQYPFPPYSEGGGEGRYIQNAGETIANTLVVGASSSTIGRYELHADGRLETRSVTIGSEGMGVFLQIGGVHETSGKPVLGLTTLTLGRWSDAEGTYQLQGGQLRMGDVSVGSAGQGNFLHTGGSFECTRLYIGEAPGSVGRYELGGTGSLRLVDIGWHIPVQVGVAGLGTFVQNGGTSNISELWLGVEAGGEGTLELSGGDMTLNVLNAGRAGRAVIRQSGGTLLVKGELRLPSDSGSARFELSGGRLETTVDKLGPASVGFQNWPNFVQTGGDHVTGGLILNGGTFKLSGNARLATQETSVSGYGDATFTQTGGTHTVNYRLVIQESLETHSIYNLSGGTLSAGTLYVGMPRAGSGEWQINSPDAIVEITSTWWLSKGARFLAVPGSTIRFRGTSFYNESDDPAAVAGLGHTTLIVNGGTKVASLPARGDINGGDFLDNFALGALIIGDDAAGHVALRGTSTLRALYAYDLHIEPGSTMDLGGQGLFVEGDAAAALDAWIADGRLFDSKLAAGRQLDAVFDAAHDWTRTVVVPEPGCLALIGAAFLVYFPHARRGPRKKSLREG